MKRCIINTDVGSTTQVSHCVLNSDLRTRPNMHSKYCLLLTKIKYEFRKLTNPRIDANVVVQRSHWMLFKKNLTEGQIQEKEAEDTARNKNNTFFESCCIVFTNLNDSTCTHTLNILCSQQLQIVSKQRQRKGTKI